MGANAAIGGASAGLSLFSSIAGSGAQSRAARESARSIQKSLNTTAAQIAESAAISKQQIGQRTRQLVGELRVFAAETGGSSADLELTAIARGLIDSETEQKSAKLQFASAVETAKAQTDSVRSSVSPPLSLQTLGTGLSLFTSGLQIKSALTQ